MTKERGLEPATRRRECVVFRGRMWILGGTENYYFGDDASLKNDAWSSADGKDWRREPATAPSSPRAYHTAVAHNGTLWVIRRRQLRLRSTQSLPSCATAV